MSSDMKYIIFKGYLCEEPVLFPSLQSHDEMSDMLSDRIGVPVSAGFVSIVDGIISAYGKSTSLDLKSRPEDSNILERFLDS